MRMKCVITLLLPVLAGVGYAGDVRIIEQIVAKVNNEIITQGDLDKGYKQIEADLKRQQLPQDRLKQALQEMRANVLRDKIDQLLLVQKAKDLDINVDADVSKRIARMQVDSGITDPDKFHEAIRQELGMSFEDYKQQMKEGFLTNEVIRREVGGRINISKAEQTKYYEEHKNEFVREEQVMLRQILISTEGKDEKGIAAAEKKAKDLVARARKGENFGNLAHDNSDDAETGRAYGELPPFKRGQLRKEIEDIVFTKDRGYVTDPFKQSNGFLILKVEEHYKAGLQPFEAVENEIMEALYSPRMQPAVREYLTKLRKDAFLEIRAGFSDTGAAPGKDTGWRDPAKLKPQTVTKEEVALRTRRKRALWMVPVPGTTTAVTSTTKNAPPITTIGPGNTVAAPGTPGATSNQQIPGAATPVPR